MATFNSRTTIDHVAQIRSFKKLYYSLEGANTKIRLVWYEQNDETDWQMGVYSLQKNGFHNPSYIALSYFWGAAEPHQTIRCNGFQLQVTPNLATVLDYIKNDDALRNQKWWIDAICIDQSDIEEKSQQVSLMPLIYSSAASTTIWLGPDPKGSESAFTAILSLAIQNTLRTSTSEDFVRDIVALELERRTYAPKQSDTSLSSWLTSQKLDKMLLRNIQEVQSLDRLLGHPWFSRAWIFQEAVVSKQAIVRTGTNAISFSSFFKACLELEQSGLDREMMHKEALHLVTHMGRLQKRFVDDNRTLGTTAHELLTLRRSAQATDARDKVFSVTAMFTDWDFSQNHALRADYSKSIEEIYTEVASQELGSSDSHLARRIIQAQLQHESLHENPSRSEFGRRLYELFEKTNCPTLDVLSAAYGLNRGTKLPTWVADWRLPPRHNLVERNALGDPRYAAAGLTTAMVQPRDKCPSLIGVGGFFFDKIARLTQSSELRDSENGPVVAKRSWALCKPDSEWQMAAKSIAVKGEYEYTGEPIITAFFSVLLADLHAASTRLDDDERNKYWSATLKEVEQSSLVMWYSKLNIWSMKVNQMETPIEKVFGVLYPVLSLVLPESWVLSFHERMIRTGMWKPLALLGYPLSLGLTGIAWIAELCYTRLRLPRMFRSARTRQHHKAIAAERNELMAKVCDYRRLMISEQGFMGLVPKETKIGDEICILFGGSVPYVLRPCPDGQSYLFVGDCYVQGIMDGEAILLKRALQPDLNDWPRLLNLEMVNGEMRFTPWIPPLGRWDPETLGIDWQYFQLR